MTAIEPTDEEGAEESRRFKAVDLIEVPDAAASVIAPRSQPPSAVAPEAEAFADTGAALAAETGAGLADAAQGVLDTLSGIADIFSVG